ncbi:MAG TPA: hypothetical protein VFZ18_12340 [Longimicrobiaceae bacterium]
MITPQNRVVSRTLGLLGVVSTLAVIWFGWWTLAISGALAVAAALLAPREIRQHHAARQVVDSVNRKLHPHSWRPGRLRPRRR